MLIICVHLFQESVKVHVYNKLLSYSDRKNKCIDWHVMLGQSDNPKINSFHQQQRMRNKYMFLRLFVNL